MNPVGPLGRAGHHRRWRRLLPTRVLSGLAQSGAKGDWWYAPGGRIMMTSMCLLTLLEVYYRHLPLYRRDVAGKK